MLLTLILVSTTNVRKVGARQDAEKEDIDVNAREAIQAHTVIKVSMCCFFFATFSIVN